MTGRIVCLSCLLIASLWAQMDNLPSVETRRVRIHLLFAEGETCDSSTSISLQGINGPVADGFVNHQCVIDLSQIPSGHYHLTISGKNLLAADMNDIDIDASDTREIEVRVRRAGDSTGGASSDPLVAAEDLKIPPSAVRELTKAAQYIAEQKWQKAIEKLNKAIAIYPNYTAAYNNLAVAYARLNDRVREREVLEKAISINERYAPAYVNLARISIAASDFPTAEKLLSKATTFDPRDQTALVLLTYTEFMDRHIDEAIEHSRQAHALSTAPHAVVHWVAARSLEQRREVPEAIAELHLFLNEERIGARADAARKELADLQAGH